MKAIVALALAALLYAQPARDWQSNFPVDHASLGITGNNTYFPLEPGTQWSYRDGKDTDTLTVVAETRTIDGVPCRIIEDREAKNGQLIELTRDYYAIDSGTNDVYYMGEEVDTYRNVKVTGHGGSWLSGVKGAKFGLMMPGAPKTGQRFYQEQAPGVGMDRVEIVSNSETVTTPAGTFRNCLHHLETTPLEKGAANHKWYAAGVGQVKDGRLLLIKYSKP